MSRFIRCTRYGMTDEVLVNIGQVRQVQTHKGDPVQQDGDRSACLIVFQGLQSNENGHTLLVNESLDEIIDKIDNAENAQAASLKERRSSHYVMNGDTLEVR